MHNIHWAIIFQNVTFYVVLLVLAVAFVRSTRADKNKPKVKMIGYGDTVKVVLAATCETHQGVVTGVAVKPGGFSITCGKD